MSHFLTNQMAQIYQQKKKKNLLPFDDLPEHSPLTNSASTLTPTPSMLYPQIQNSPDLLLQIPTLKYKIIFPDSLQRADPL